MPQLCESLITALALALLISSSGCTPVARHFLETKALTTGPNGPETPASVGVPFERVQLASGPRHLDTYLVNAAPSCGAAPLVLIYHGVQETISEWVQAQRFLFQHCVSSAVFDPTGSGDSSRPARLEAVNEDAVAAYEQIRSRFPKADIFVLGHSMGNGPLLQAVPQFRIPPNGVIVGGAFASLRAAGGRSGFFLFRWLAKLGPDWWNNVEAVQRVTVPVLVIHSDADRVNPLAEGEQIYAAAHDPKQLAIVHGLKHNALYKEPSEAWWHGVLVFISAHQTRN